MVGAEPIGTFFQDLAREDPEHRRHTITEAAGLLIGGEACAAHILLRDLILGAYGTEDVATAAGLSEQAVGDYLGGNGATDDGLALAVLRGLARMEQIEMSVSPIETGSGREAAE